MRFDTRCVAGLMALAILPASPALPPRAAPTRVAVADSGAFVIRHAADTVAMERFTRTPTGLTGTLEIRNEKQTLQSYKAVVAPDASVALIEVTVKERPIKESEPRVVHSARVIFKEDSAAVDDMSERGLQTRVFGTERGAVPYLNLSFALLEQAVLRSRDPGAAAGQVPLFNLGGGQVGGGQTLDAKVSPLGGDSVVIAIGNVEFRLRVDPRGRVLGGRIPAQNVEVERTS